MRKQCAVHELVSDIKNVTVESLQPLNITKIPGKNVTEIKNQKIAIIGAGAIGSLIGGLLALDGEDITLIGNPSHLSAIDRSGLSINGVKGEYSVHLKTSTALDFTPDIAFLGVKTQDVESACQQIAPYVKDSVVVLMQNGVRSIEIASRFIAKQNIISCVLLLNAQFIKPGKVTYIHQGPTIIGHVASNDGNRLCRIRMLLDKISQTFISKDIIRVQWSKLLINAFGNSLDGMTGQRLGDYIDSVEMRKIGVLILKEALELMEKANIHPVNLPGIPVSLFKYVIKTPLPVASAILKVFMKSKSNENITTSTLQSLKKGKKTEIDYLNGEFVKIAQELGTKAPYNTMVLQLIHEIETTGRFFTPAELHFQFSSINKSTDCGP